MSVLQRLLRNQTFLGAVRVLTQELIAILQRPGESSHFLFVKPRRATVVRSVDNLHAFLRRFGTGAQPTQNGLP